MMIPHRMGSRSGAAYRASVRAVATVVAAAVLAGAIVATAPATLQPLRGGNNFFSNCYLSRIATDDPIVYPHQPGRSHSHTFFGSKSTNANSTTASLRASRTTCRRHADTAAYWVPTLYGRGIPIKPTKGSAYFVLKSRSAIHPFPPGLKMIAGDPHALAPQSLTVTFWSCSGLEGKRWLTPHSCNTRPHKHRPLRLIRRPHQSLLQLDVVFPDCWDGHHLDSPNHRSHMAYSHNFDCPRSHPVKVPRLRFIVTYPIVHPMNLSLASGGIYSAHADFINAWHQKPFARLVTDCFLGRRGCDAPPR